MKYFLICQRFLQMTHQIIGVKKTLTIRKHDTSWTTPDGIKRVRVSGKHCSIILSKEQERIHDIPRQFCRLTQSKDPHPKIYRLWGRKYINIHHVNKCLTQPTRTHTQWLKVGKSVRYSEFNRKPMQLTERF